MIEVYEVLPFTLAANVKGLLPAVKLKNFSGRAPHQIHFYLWARPAEQVDVSG
jgi:hypothetical protein